jgi:hypothetical protein
MAVTEKVRSVEMTAADDELDKVIPVKSIKWVYKTGTAGDECKVVDSAGDVVFHSVARDTNWNEERPVDRLSINRPKVTVLAGGTVYLFKQ